ncbi:hypothetical protein MRX96_034948 [Rhipicephalus microplus]
MEDCSSVIQGEHQKRPVRRSMTSQTSIGLKKMRSLVAATKTLRRKCSRLKEMNSNLHSQLEKLKKDFFRDESPRRGEWRSNAAVTLSKHFFPPSDSFKEATIRQTPVLRFHHCRKSS